MLTTQHAPQRTRLATEHWAQRLATRLADRQAPADILPEQAIAMAVGTFWALFDETMAEANFALEVAGLPERIRVRRRPNERTFYLDGAETPPSHVQITMNLRVTAGHIEGGALLAASRTRACVFLVPSFGGGEARWRIQASGMQLHADMIRDLFLSVFADDPAATHRLSPLSGSEFFGNPWL